MKKLILTLALFLIASPASANTTGYAWSESVGWFDFSDAVVANTTVTGYAYNDNTGWLVLDGITNDGTGILDGYAWSESVGYFDFYGVTITDGAFEGYAYNDNTGWLSFDDGTAVTTTWTIATAVEEQTSSKTKSQRKRIMPPKPLTPNTSPSVNTPSSTPTTNIRAHALSNNPRDLELNATGDDVKLLQQFLNQQGFSVNTPGAIGSIGYETNFFGNLTQQALIKFQIKHNINPPAGYFGPITRAFIKTLQN